MYINIYMDLYLSVMWPVDLRDLSPSHTLDRKHTSTRTAAALQGGGGGGVRYSTGTQPGICAVIPERKTGGENWKP